MGSRKKEKGILRCNNVDLFIEAFGHTNLHNPSMKYSFFCKNYKHKPIARVYDLVMAKNLL
jgi:hypothetical protein